MSHGPAGPVPAEVRAKRAALRIAPLTLDPSSPRTGGRGTPIDSVTPLLPRSLFPPHGGRGTSIDSIALLIRPIEGPGAGVAGRLACLPPLLLPPHRSSALKLQHLRCPRRPAWAGAAPRGLSDRGHGGAGSAGPASRGRWAGERGTPPSPFASRPLAPRPPTSAGVSYPINGTSSSRARSCSRAPAAPRAPRAAAAAPPARRPARSGEESPAWRTPGDLPGRDRRSAESPPPGA